jgi:hypothetical protein
MKTTAERNKAFGKLSPARQRMAIARDVLAQLATGKIVAESGTYFDSLTFKVRGAGTQLQKSLQQMESCDVCAIGSLFVCGVLKANALTAGEAGVSGDYIGSGIMTSYLSRFFTREQLGLIESAFETDTGYAESPSSLSARDAVRFGNHVNDLADQLNADNYDEIKLQLIMQNIIKNKGTFVPTQLPKLTIVA